MNLIGKTIVGAVQPTSYGGDLYLTFSDGTHARIEGTGYEAEGVDVEAVSGKDVHEIQKQWRGHVEQARMRRLHDMLHPRDKQWLKLQADEARRRRRAVPSASAFSRVLAHQYEGVLRDMMRAPSLLFAEHPPLKKKRRPPRKLPEGTITIPVKRRRARRV